jgi:Effector-associated domain 1/CHAT domain
MGEDELTQDEIFALAETFAVGTPALTLLRMAGFPAAAIPSGRDRNALEFWTEVADQVARGVMRDGRRSLLAAARRRYPYSTKFPDPPAGASAGAFADAQPGASAGGQRGAVAGRAGPLRVLVIGASPSDLPPVRADRESRAIIKAVVPGRLDVDDVPGAEATDLERVGSFRPDILHFICHGEQDSLVFNDVRGESDPVKAGRIAETLGFYQHSAGVRLRGIVLAACDGETVAPLLAGAADTVIAHRGKLSDPCGVAFATQFYRRLNETDDLAAAAREAAHLTAQFSAACDAVIASLIVLPGGG